MYNRRHRAGSHPVKWRHAVAQITEKLTFGPRNRRRIGVCQRRRDPVVDGGARVGVGLLFGAEQVAGGVTAAAKAEPFRQVGATVPLSTFGCVRLIAAAPEEQDFPAFLQKTDVEREWNCVRGCYCPDRWLRRYISVERFDIVVRNLGEVVVGECREKVRSIARVNASRDQRPIPVSESGVMLGE